MSAFIDALDELAGRRVVFFGGKGGVGKTTVASAAALRFSDSRRTILFSTDPASSLADLLGQPKASNRRLRIESIDAGALYQRFLETNLDSFLEIGDRGTYLDRDELRRLFELSLPGVDELMAWMRIGELAESGDWEMVVVDTAPTGHTLRMLASSEHFRQLAVALDAMEEKHRAIVRHLARRNVRDAIDSFIDDFEAQARRRREMFGDPKRCAFVPVTLAEPLVIEQTQHLIREVEEEAGIDVPFVVLNRARGREALAQFSRVVLAPRACVPLNSARRLRQWSAGNLPAVPPAVGRRAARGASRGSAGPRPALRCAPLLFFAGKGGVGKTSCSASVALQLARRNRNHRYVIISVDPAHSLRDLFAHEEPPSNLAVETIDTKAKWREFRESTGADIERAVDALTPRGMSLQYDAEAIRRLLDIAPPGADELFAITRLSDLIATGTLAGVIVDTAPTGHFLRLLDLPRQAGEWVRELMRLLLRYKDLVPPASLGEELVRASRALKDLDETLRSERTSVVVVTRPERIVIAETKRLLDELRRRGIPLGGVIANYLTAENDDPCDRSMRTFEMAALVELGDVVSIERRDTPPSRLRDLESLVPLSQRV